MARYASENPSNAALYAVGDINGVPSEAGPGCTSGETFEETKALFERLDEEVD
jgi:hypothetical protein